MKILFLVPYPQGEAPSQRFRFEQYLSFIRENGNEITVSSFLSLPAWRILYLPGNGWRKALYVLQGFARRKWDILRSLRYDLVFIHREAAPVGPPVIEWLLAVVLRKKIIYDFDDAIWLPNTSVENKLVAGLKCHWKTGKICKMAWKVSVGNDYLGEYASIFNPNVVVIPTTIGTHAVPAIVPVRSPEKLVIGWTGTHSTLKYLLPVLPVLQQLASEWDFELLVICNTALTGAYLPLKVTNIRWNKSSETDDLLQFDMGIMPLEDDAWTRGKCGFKALQYMALGIPTVAGNVGVNKQIIQDGISGFLVTTPLEWEQALKNLLSNGALRKSIGQKGREVVNERYSVEANKEKYRTLISDGENSRERK